MNKPKVIGYIPLMYGAEYLAACIQSMEPFVEQLHIVYVKHPSQGHGTSEPCPETEQQLQDIAYGAIGNAEKLIWHSCETFPDEGSHRSYINRYTEGFDVLFTLDADEVAEPADVEHAILEAYNGESRYYGIDGFTNFWRSFNFVCLDGFRPIRLINLHMATGQSEIKLRVYHFGCCQSIRTIRYKWHVSGHKYELKLGWIDKTYLGWRPDNQIQDLHPVAYNLWNAVPFDRHTMPAFLQQHPNFNREIVE